MRLLWGILLGGCVDHTYAVGVDALVHADIQISLSKPPVANAPGGDVVEIGFPAADPTAGCPVLSDDLTLRLGDAELTGSRGGYDDGHALFGQSEPPSCVRALLRAPTPSAAPTTIDLVVTGHSGTARVTIAAPYVERSLATPSTFVPGTTAHLTWAPSTDAIRSPASILCTTTVPGPGTNVLVASTDPAPSDNVHVPLAYDRGVLSFPIPSDPIYRGPLVCYLILFPVFAKITECTGFSSCVALPRSLRGIPEKFDATI